MGLSFDKLELLVISNIIRSHLRWIFLLFLTLNCLSLIEEPLYSIIQMLSQYFLWIFFFLFFFYLLNCFYRRRQWHPTPVLLPGKSHGWRSLVGCGPSGHKESDMTEWLHFHFPLSSIGEGNGNSLQCSSLENPRDGGAWWAAVCGVAQSQTRLKRLSSSTRGLKGRFLDSVSGLLFQFLGLGLNLCS